MTTQKRTVRSILVAAVMVFCFYAGWIAYGVQHRDPPRMIFDFSKPFRVPPTHVPFSQRPTAKTDPFVVGDRIDIFARVENRLQPLVIDAIVMQQTKRDFGMLLPGDGIGLLSNAMNQDLQLVYRPTVAVSDPIALEPYAP